MLSFKKRKYIDLFRPQGTEVNWSAINGDSDDLDIDANQSNKRQKTSDDTNNSK